MTAPQIPTSPGPGWWLASDGRWYPPHLHPSVTAPEAPVIPTPAQPGTMAGWTPAQPGAAGWTPTQPGAAGWTPTQPGAMAGWTATQPGQQSAVGVSARRKSRTIPLLLGVVVALVAVEVGLVVTSSGTSASAAVADAVQTTLAEHTATVAVTESIGADGTNITLHGTGIVNFSNSQMALSISASELGQSMTIKMVVSSGTVYEQIPEISQLVPGKSWASIDLSGLIGTEGGGSAGAAGELGNVSAELKLLTLQGDQVRGLGPSTVDGTSVQGYSVTVTKAAVTRALQHDSGLPQWIKAYSSELTSANGQQMLYVNSANQLVEQTMHLDDTVEGASEASSFTYQYSDFGAPVSVTVPPASEVVSLQQLLQDAAARAGQDGAGTGSTGLGSPAPGSAGAGSCPAGGAPQVS